MYTYFWKTLPFVLRARPVAAQITKKCEKQLETFSLLTRVNSSTCFHPSRQICTSVHRNTLSIGSIVLLRGDFNTDTEQRKTKALRCPSAASGIHGKLEAVFILVMRRRFLDVSVKI